MNEFIFIHPKKNRPSSKRAKDSVRIGYTKSKKKPQEFVLTVYIGRGVAKKMDLSAGDKVTIGYDASNPRRVLFKKSVSGYTLSELKGQNSPAFRIMLMWPAFQPVEEITEECKQTFNDELDELGQSILDLINSKNNMTSIAIATMCELLRQLKQIRNIKNKPRKVKRGRPCKK